MTNVIDLFTGKPMKTSPAAMVELLLSKGYSEHEDFRLVNVKGSGWGVFARVYKNDVTFLEVRSWPYVPGENGEPIKQGSKNLDELANAIQCAAKKWCKRKPKTTLSSGGHA